jgi:hypothetical protein
MKLPARKSTLFLALFLVVEGGTIVLALDKTPLFPTLHAITGLLAIAAGVFLWLERPANN